VGELRQSAQLTIGVLPFEDDRPSPQVLGQRVRSDGKKEKILLQSPSPSEDVTYLLRRSLKARGVKVRELSRWEPAPANLKDLPQEVDVAIAGRIKTMEVKAQSSTFKTVVSYRVEISAHLGFKAQRRVVTKSIGVEPEETLVIFDPEKIEQTLNEAVDTALGRLIEAALSSAK
jgi:hypothetical protein